MILRIVVIATAALVVLIAYLGYTDLPETMEDRYRAMVALAMNQLLAIKIWHLSSWLGYGSFLENVATLGRFPEPDLSTPPQSASLGVLEVTRRNLAGIQVIMYRPKDVAEDELLPGLIYFHGGGFCMHHPDFHDFASHHMANCTRQITLSIDYRLAPKDPFPAGLEDGVKVAKYVLKNGKSLGIDVNRLGFIGDSSGGNLAAATVLALSTDKKSGLPAIKYQILVNPVIQVMDMQTPSYVELGDRIQFPSQERMAGNWAAYLGLDISRVEEYALKMKYNRHVPPELLKNSKYAKYLDRKNLPEKFRKPRPEIQKHYYTPPEKVGVVGPYDKELYDQIKDKIVNPLLSPLMAPDLTGLPPTLVIVSEFDPLRDDGLLYAGRLRQAGVKTDVHISGGFHADFFPMLPGLHSKTGEKSLNAMCSFMRKEA